MISDENGQRLKDLEKIISHLPMGITYKDLDFRIQSMNPYFLDKLGMSLDDVKGRRCYEVGAESRGENPSRAKICDHCLVPKALKTGEIQSFVYKVNDDLIIETTTIPVKGESGTIVGTVELLQDITKRQKAKEALRKVHDELETTVEQRTAELKEANTRLKTLLRSIPDLVAFKDAGGRYLLTNKALEEFKGVRHNALIGKTTDDILPPEVAAQCRLSDEKAMRSEEPIRSEEYIGKDEARIVLETIKTPIRDKKGNVKGLVMVSRDITERKRAEEALQEAHSKLEIRVKERTVELQKTYNQLLHSEKLAAVGKLSASIAHEFNNPLYGIQSVLEGIKINTALGETDQKLIDLALSECRRIKGLISNLQDFHKPSTGNKESVDIHTMLDDMLSLVRKEYKNAHIPIQKKYASSLPAIKVVQDQIKQVVLNLLANAKDSIRRGKGMVTITTENLGRWAAIRISDTGYGIAPDILPHIFEPFYTTKSSVKGTGLGLSVSYGIIKAHGGEIEVDNTPGRGTTFSILLPLNEEPDDQAEHINC
jgi:PAS domain S-box-containing protein